MTNLKSRSTSAFAAIGLMAVIAAAPAEATHWRGGSIAWTATGTNEITFDVTTYWRRDFPFSVGSNGNLGATVNTDTLFNFGDATSTTLIGTVTELNAPSNWFGVTSTIVHTYATATNFVASLTNCCRLSSLENNNDSEFRIQSTVTVGGTDNSPNAGGSSPIFLVPDGGIQVFNPFSLTDPDGGTHTYALASAAQAGTGFTQPTALSINSATGDVTWNTDAAGAAVGQLWSVSFLITDESGNTAPLDILLSMCQDGTAGCGDFEPPTESIPAPGTLSIAALGLLGMAGAIRRRRRKS